MAVLHGVTKRGAEALVLRLDINSMSGRPMQLFDTSNICKGEVCMSFRRRLSICTLG